MEKFNLKNKGWFKKGCKSLNGMLGKKLSKESIIKRTETRKKNGWYKDFEETKKKISGKKSANWKDNDIGKSAMHYWIVNQKGKALEHKCVDCGKQAQEWSNINNHIYRRILNDYEPRCRKCHKKYDKK